jgi:hypothetical protein
MDNALRNVAALAQHYMASLLSGGQAKNIIMLGKGPSLDRIVAADVLEYDMIIGVKHAAKIIAERLAGTEHPPVVGVQQDIGLGMSCPSLAVPLFFIRHDGSHDISTVSMQGSTRVVRYDPCMFRLNASSNTTSVAVHFARIAGCERITFAAYDSWFVQEGSCGDESQLLEYATGVPYPVTRNSSCRGRFVPMAEEILRECQTLKVNVMHPKTKALVTLPQKGGVAYIPWRRP